MGQLILDNAVQALKAAGIPAERGYPGSKAAAVTVPCAAVNLQQAALRGQTLTVVVSVLSPAELGAAACEEAALNAGEVLTEQGGECTVSGCEFDGRSGLFTAQVTAKYLTAVPQVKLEGQLLQYVEAFTCWQTVDEDAGITSLDDAGWNFRLEEFFPVGVKQEEGPEEPFGLIHISENGTETFYRCKWTYQRRVWGATGIRQIRLGSAEYMTIG